MNTVRNLLFLSGLATALWAQPNLFFNQGALVYVQSGALLYVQGGYVNNDNGPNQGVTENYGTIRLVNTAGGWRGNLTNGTGAEFNTYSGSWVYLQGDFTNDGYYRAGMTGYGGTIEFNGTDIQTYQNTANVQAWTLDTVRINNTGPLNLRHVRILSTTTQDMHIRSRLHFQSGRIHTEGNTEVRMINSDPNAITRQLGAPAIPAPANFATLVDPENRHQYIYGALRWYVTAGNTYPFIVGGDPATHGIQQIDVQISNTAGSGNHYVRVRFDPTVQGSFTNTTYCRPGDETDDYPYRPLNNGRWEVMPFTTISATTPSNHTDLAGVTMHNRVVTNATSDGSCPPAGDPGDAYWPTYPTDKCYVGYNQRSGAGDQLTPPDNCEGSNTGFQVTRTGFGRYDRNGTYYYATVWTIDHPLPSDELRLSAAPAGQAIRLTWNITHPEAEYILGYELYRKTENGIFTRIAQIDKQGRMQYTHDDAYVAPNTRYFYQVGQHDVFGHVRYSNIVEAMLPSRGDGFSAQLQPNPITSEGSLMVNIPSEGMLAFTLYDAAGKVVAQHSWTLAAGAHQLDLAPILAQVAAGNYNAYVTFGSEVKTLRLIKLDHTR
jgi:hypothetical protein